MPVIVWVAPAGGWAASAGTFITLAANLAVHGARDAHRRRVADRRHGQDIPGTLGEKVKNDAIAKITVDRRGPRPAGRLGGLDGRRGARRTSAERGGRSARSTGSPRRSTRSLAQANGQDGARSAAPT